MEDENKIFGRLRAIGVRFHRNYFVDKEAEEVTWVPNEVTETDEGYTISLIDGRGDTIGHAYLNKNEQVLKIDFT